MNRARRYRSGGFSGGSKLEAGENNYAYMFGLNDTIPKHPLSFAIADGFRPERPVTILNKSSSPKGGVWAAKKAVVIFCRRERPKIP